MSKESKGISQSVLDLWQEDLSAEDALRVRTEILPQLEEANTFSTPHHLRRALSNPERVVQRGEKFTSALSWLPAKMVRITAVLFLAAFVTFIVQAPSRTTVAKNEEAILADAIFGTSESDIFFADIFAEEFQTLEELL